MVCAVAAAFSFSASGVFVVLDVIDAVGIIITCHCGKSDGMYLVANSLTKSCILLSLTGRPRYVRALSTT